MKLWRFLNPEYSFSSVYFFKTLE